MMDERYLRAVRDALVRHQQWLLRDPAGKGRRANLSFYELGGLGLNRVNLSGAQRAGGGFGGGVSPRGCGGL